MPGFPVLPAKEVREVLDTLETGDLLLFSGRGPASETVRLFTRSAWSHVGMVLRREGETAPLLLESTTLSSTPDVHTGSPVKGVAVVSLLQRLADYDGRVALRRRQGAPVSAREHRLVRRLVARLLHRPYRNYVLSHLHAMLPGMRASFSALFCSQLVAEIYRRLDWLPRDGSSRRFVPQHFACPSFRLRGARLSEPVELLLPGRGAAPLHAPQSPLVWSSGPARQQAIGHVVSVETLGYVSD